MLTNIVPVLNQPLPDKEGKKCLLFIKCAGKSFEISASDKKRKQEWIQGKNCFMFTSMEMEPQATSGGTTIGSSNYFSTSMLLPPPRR